jgi:hypothetical protein
VVQYVDMNPMVISLAALALTILVPSGIFLLSRANAVALDEVERDGDAAAREGAKERDADKESGSEPGAERGQSSSRAVRRLSSGRLRAAGAFLFGLAVLIAASTTGWTIETIASAEKIATNTPTSASPVRGTVVHTLFLGAGYDKAFDDLDNKSSYAWGADCWARSITSARTDGRTCALGGYNTGMLFDPCFTYKNRGVVCFDGTEQLTGSTPGRVAKVIETFPAPAWLPMDGLVTAEQAEKTAFPWAIKIDLRDATGNQYICVPLLGENKEGFTTHSFGCGGRAVLISLDEQHFRAGDKWMKVESGSPRTATSLDKNKPTWTVLLADPESNELKLVNVLDAWF